MPGWKNLVNIGIWPVASYGCDASLPEFSRRQKCHMTGNRWNRLVPDERCQPNCCS